MTEPNAVPPVRADDAGWPRLRQVQRVRIRHPRPTSPNHLVVGTFTTVEVNGEQWAVDSYRLEESARGVMTLTLTFPADVTVEYREEPQNVPDVRL